MEENFCKCERWNFYINNYSETFYWHSTAKHWYVQWVDLSEQGGYTQVSRYAIPISFCPLCGGKLNNPEED
jgi:hypothetical protein